jgi:acyl transferase domain-containing protein
VGRCRTFDAAADGYGRGEGFASLLLTQHRAPSGAGSGCGAIHARLCGTAVNQDGRSSSLTAPNGPSQQALVAAALAAAALGAAAVGLVAVHGTGG